MKYILTILLLFAVTGAVVCQDKKNTKQTNILPGQPWLDNKGKHINAHSGGILFFNGVYYWHGEYKLESKAEKDTADGGISCYTSTDLINWNNAGVVLSVDYKNPDSDIAYGCILERPKIIFNEQTKKFVAFFKLYLKGDGYTTAYVGVAVSNSPLGPFTYSHKFLACGSVNGSGDFSMYKDDDGYLYHIAVRKPDKRLCYARMNNDYMLPAQDYTPYPEVELHTEAPAIVKYNGIYHLIGSGSMGWAPTAPRYYTSKNLQGPWKAEINPLEGINPVNKIGVEKTFGGQSTFICKIQGLKDKYIAMFDVWKPDAASTGGYIWLPIVFKDNRLLIKWVDSWNPNAFKK
jgi:Glycosyl hydrolases family 43